MTHQERGAAAVEVTLLVPLLITILLALAGGWRVGWARTQVVEVAAAGARAATIATSASQAQLQAGEAIRADLATLGVHCAELHIAIDTSAFATPPGTPATVTAQVGCRLNLSDVLVPGLPGSLQLNAAASEPLDIFRERTP